MKFILLIGIALTLFIPPIVSIIFGGADIGKKDMEIGKFLNKENFKDK